MLRFSTLPENISFSHLASLPAFRFSLSLPPPKKQEESASIAGIYVVFVLISALYYFTIVAKRPDNAAAIDPTQKKVVKPFLVR